MVIVSQLFFNVHEFFSCGKYGKITIILLCFFVEFTIPLQIFCWNYLIVWNRCCKNFYFIPKNNWGKVHWIKFPMIFKRFVYFSYLFGCFSNCSLNNRWFFRDFFLNFQFNFLILYFRFLTILLFFHCSVKLNDLSCVWFKTQHNSGSPLYFKWNFALFLVLRVKDFKIYFLQFYNPK